MPWLGGLALLSCLGDYDGGQKVIGFGIAIPITFLFSIAIYLIALCVRLDPATVEEHIEQTRAEAAQEEAELG